MLACEPGSGVTPTPQESYQKLMRYLYHLSGQEKVSTNQDHTYARPWNRHPDPAIKSRAARFLFMKGFPRHMNPDRNNNNADIDIMTVDEEPYETGETPLVTEINALAPKTPVSASAGSASAAAAAALQPSVAGQSDAWGLNEKPPPIKTHWTPTQHKLWSKSLRILNSDRLGRLSADSKANELVLKRNQLEKTAARFRQSFACIAFYDQKMLTWLQTTLQSHILPLYLVPFHESMQLLRQKVPGLIERFYQPIRSDPGLRQRMNQSDLIQTVLNNHRPKRITGSPLFLIVPNGPQIPHHFTSQRMKHWNNLFGSLGKVITVTVAQKSRSSASDCLYEIRIAVRDKIKECKATFSEGRPLVLVGFGSSSLIAAHCALDNGHRVTAVVLLGFPLTGVNGFRGDLDDPLLEIAVPTLFVIGQNSSMCTLDDMEDFRERITKTQTGLVVVGGCSDRLVLCGAKKRSAGITQGMVDRCIADEIFDFVTSVLSSGHYDASPSTPTSANSMPRQMVSVSGNTGANRPAAKRPPPGPPAVPGVVKRKRK